MFGMEWKIEKKPAAGTRWKTSQLSRKARAMLVPTNLDAFCEVLAWCVEGKRDGRWE
jgi:hypothetical protein